MGKKTTTSGGYTLGRAVINARENLPAAKRKKNKLDVLKRQKAGQIDVNSVPAIDIDQELHGKPNQNMFSVTEQNDLEEFLAKAQLAGAQFTAERSHISLVNGANKLVGVTTPMAAEEARLKTERCREMYKSYLTIPRRPHWEKTTTAEELQKLENEAFLIWRRKLAELEEVEQVILTPFERNIEIWRQLWRVLERSHIVVQILDARDPLLFRCEDLESYVKELSIAGNLPTTGIGNQKDANDNNGDANSNPSNKINVLLLNKSDYLTENQRKIWCRYFNQQNIRAVFWSAIDLKDENVSGHLLKNLTIKEEDNYSSNESENESDSQDVEKSQKAQNLTVDDEFSQTLNTPDLMTREGFIDYMKNLKHQLAGLEDDTILTLGMVGYPNVGKSSTINKLLLRKKVAVSSTPGKTKHFQTLQLDQEGVILCDCPGLVMPSLAMNKEQMTLSGILSPDQMRQYESVIDLLCSKFPKGVFEAFYGLTLPKNEGEKELEPQNVSVDPHDLLTSYAFVRGFMSPKGLPDCSRAARVIVKDYVCGKLLYRQAPPGSDQSLFNDGNRDWLKKVSAPTHAKSDSSGCQEKANRPIKDKEQQKTTAASQVLRTLQKRHLLIDEGGVQGEIDRVFFGTRTPGTAHVQSSKPVMVTADGKPPKKSNRNQKRDKLRRVYGHLDA